MQKCPFKLETTEFLHATVPRPSPKGDAHRKAWNRVNTTTLWKEKQSLSRPLLAPWESSCEHDKGSDIVRKFEWPVLSTRTYQNDNISVP